MPEGRVKRSLLQTTALVTAGLIAAGQDDAFAQQQKGPQVTISGFYDVDAFWSKQKEGAVGRRAKVDLITDTEILFNVRVDLDNGIRLDGRVELEGNSVVTDPIDETWLRIQGFFGQLYLGARNPEAYKNTYLAPDVGTGTEDFQNLVANPSGASASGESPFLDSRLRMGCDDCDNITYVTPRWEGASLPAPTCRTRSRTTTPRSRRSIPSMARATPSASTSTASSTRSRSGSTRTTSRGPRARPAGRATRGGSLSAA
ncbi:MAG: porin [Alphaproteobacteria bacterium]|nr:porin [Alphaproteobacteria bacterium]